MENSALKPLQFGLVILAAGASRRMGKQKLLLPWHDTTVLGHLVRQWSLLGAAQIGCVCASRAAELQTEFGRCSAAAGDRASVIINPNPERGMFSSIQCAANWPGWKTNLTGWVITLGDQPQLCPGTLRALLDYGATHPEKICQPMRRGRYKHPVLLPKRFFLELATSAEPDLKQFLSLHRGDSVGFESDDEGLDHDLDTPEDYVRLTQSSGSA